MHLFDSMSSTDVTRLNFAIRLHMHINYIEASQITESSTADSMHTKYQCDHFVTM